MRTIREIEEEEEILREIKRQQRLEIERQKQIEKEKLEKLETDAKNWEITERLRNYISAVERKIKKDHPRTLPDGVNKWIAWAKNHVNKIDTLNIAS